MRKCLILITVVFISFGFTNAYGSDPNCAAGTCLTATWNESLGKFVGCDDKKETGTCTCLGPYGGSSWVDFDCGCVADYECLNGYCNNGTCIACKTCSNCETTNWATYLVEPYTGYQSRTVKSCSCRGTCSSKTEYRCAAGYYGTSTNGRTGCTQCPEWTNVYTTSARSTKVRGTSNAGATAITECFVATGTYYDVSGTFKISSNCTYK